MAFIAAAIMAAGQVYKGIQGAKQGDAEARMARQAFKQENPFGPYRKKYAEMLGGLMDDPSSFLDNPLYKSAYDMGTSATARSGAAGGYVGSGNMATELQRFGQGYAWDALREQEKFLSHLAGADIDPNFAAPLAAFQQSGQTQMQGTADIANGAASLYNIGFGQLKGMTGGAPTGGATSGSVPNTGMIMDTPRGVFGNTGVLNS